MKEFAKRWIGVLIDWRRLVSLRYLPRFVADWRAFRRQAGSWSVKAADGYPCLADRLPATPFDPHYFYQGNWLARRLAEAKPRQHVDIGSSVLTVAGSVLRTDAAGAFGLRSDAAVDTKVVGLLPGVPVDRDRSVRIVPPIAGSG